MHIDLQPFQALTAKLVSCMKAKGGLSMQAYEVLRELLKTSTLSARAISRKIGRSENYLAVLLAKKYDPLTTTMTRILDVMDCDLLVRSRTNGREYTIAPPPEETE